jgi:hypothetical protein
MVCWSVRQPEDDMPCSPRAGCCRSSRTQCGVLDVALWHELYIYVHPRCMRPVPYLLFPFYIGISDACSTYTTLRFRFLSFGRSVVGVLRSLASACCPHQHKPQRVHLETDVKAPSFQPTPPSDLAAVRIHPFAVLAKYRPRLSPRHHGIQILRCAPKTGRRGLCARTPR